MTREAGIYVHFPFCRVRCSYCPFAISTDQSREGVYISALLREIDVRRDPSLGVLTVFFGGGTPSRTGVEHLAAVTRRLEQAFDLTGVTEFTIEANPEDVTAESLDGWKRFGVTRLSIGVQSFHDEELRPLGRFHGREGAITAVSLARASSFSSLSLSLDLILGLPGQTGASFNESLSRALDLEVDHISIYMLDLEEKTSLEKQVAEGRISLPEDEDVAEWYLSAVEACDAAGLPQYEISNFARPGHQCAHNLRYWRREPYVGLGLGAHSFQGSQRMANSRDLSEYVERGLASGVATTFEETLGKTEEMRERIFLSLRQRSGIRHSDLIEWKGKEGIEWSDRGIREGWLERSGERVGFTPRGFLVSTELIAQLF